MIIYTYSTGRYSRPQQKRIYFNKNLKSRKSIGEEGSDLAYVRIKSVFTLIKNKE